MIAFGGGAPLHASRLCDKLEIERLLIPPGAGVGSAIGFLQTPFSYEALKSFYVSTQNFDHKSVNKLLVDLTSEATEFVMDASNEKHNIASQEMLLDQLPNIKVSISSEVSPFADKSVRKSNIC